MCLAFHILFTNIYISEKYSIILKGKPLEMGPLQYIEVFYDFEHKVKNVCKQDIVGHFI